MIYLTIVYPKLAQIHYYFAHYKKLFFFVDRPHPEIHFIASIMNFVNSPQSLLVYL